MPRTRDNVIVRGVVHAACGTDGWRWRKGTVRDGDWRCVACDRKTGAASKRKMGLDPCWRLWRGAKHRGGADCRLTIDDVRAVWPADGRCPALGIPLSFGDGAPHDHSPTLDRLNSSWGYAVGNIAVLSYRANRAKGNLQAEEMELIAAWMRRQGLN